MTTQEWIEQQLALAEKATLGPWDASNVEKILQCGDPGYQPGGQDWPRLVNDADFIAAAREGYPKALRMLQARPTREQIEKLRKSGTHLRWDEGYALSRVTGWNDAINAVLALWNAAIEEAMK